MHQPVPGSAGSRLKNATTKGVMGSTWSSMLARPYTGYAKVEGVS